MRSVKIEPVGVEDQAGALIIDVECDCGKHLALHSLGGGHPAYCPVCEKAYYLRSHSDHYHVRAETMTRAEILQENYGHVLARA